MKKYIKFVMGLILISVLLNPIIKFCTQGQDIISNKINDYQKEFSNGNINNINNTSDEKSVQEEEFKNKFNNNCKEILLEKYPDLQFNVKIDGKVDFDTMKFGVNNLYIGVLDNSIKKVQEVIIDKEVNNNNYDEFLLEIRKYISEKTKISEEKIQIKYE